MSDFESAMRDLVMAGGSSPDEIESLQAGIMALAEPAPRCYDCLTTDVAVKVIGPAGLELWLCAADWKADREFHGKLTAAMAAPSGTRYLRPQRKPRRTRPG